MSIRDRLQSWGNTNTDEAMTLVMEKNISHEKNTKQKEMFI